ncbi:hypothetical protein [Burkholderia vietnamiensis]|uniref:hypothetical protein n=1 Tax=Burkholderia vietnamiensis TaxID=60552 RepID=UPI000758571B|nr:hypothetical protein [Burkholderia vietnamiensis]KVS06739.1 hypothetical protein WK29_23600 [Burkholderia vietnamiensis]MCA7985208.1 hypothetical protein [Burkholderia vietnamiensis]
MDEREILRIAVRHDIDSYLTEALTLEFVRDVLKAARRTTPDREEIVRAATAVIRDALDDVQVHPCDQYDDDVKARQLPVHMHALYLALQSQGDFK